MGLKKQFLLPAPYSELQLELAAQHALNQMITSGRRSHILGVRKFKCASRFSSFFWQSMMMMMMRSQRFLLLVKVHTPAQSNLHHIRLLQRVKYTSELPSIALLKNCMMNFTINSIVKNRLKKMMMMLISDRQQGDMMFTVGSLINSTSLDAIPYYILILLQRI